MKTKFRLLLILLFTTGSLFSQQQPVYRPGKKVNPDALKPGDYYEDQLYIKFKPGFDNQLETQRKKTATAGNETGIPRLDAISRKYGVKKLSASFDKILKDPSRQGNHHAWALDRWFTVDLPKGASVIEAIKAYQSLTDIIETAEPSYRRVLFDADQPVVLWTPNDSAYSSQWHFNNTGQQGATSPPGIDADINLPEAWNTERGKPAVIVAVIDGGVDTSHPDLRQNLWIGSDGTRFGINWNNSGMGIQPEKHGTHVAGTIAAVNNNGIGVSGIAGGDGTPGSGARIMNMQVFDPSGVYAGDAAVASAFVYAADHGACIAQNSWGGGDFSTLITDAIDYFIMNGGGTVLNGGIAFFSAGNNGAESEQFPGNYPPVVCVAATDYNDQKASYSVYGPWVDISAPGGDGSGFKQILSTITNKGYGWLSGTSMACPHVSGVAALCVSKAQGLLSNDQLRNILLSSADDIYPLNPGYTGKLGSGRVNASNALQATLLATGTSINPVVNFTASQSCGTVTLSWTKNAQNNNVIIAEADTLLFGTPAGTLQAGDTLAGGGRIIYNGSAISFTATANPNQRRYFSIWSYAGNQYSFHKTGTVLYEKYIGDLVIADSAQCVINLSWNDDLSCPSDSILLVASNRMVFSNPAGIVRTGDVLPSGDRVIYKGNASSYRYITDFDSTVYIGKWNFNSSHQYTDPPADAIGYATKSNAIRLVTAKAKNDAEIDISWQPETTSNCFGGSSYLLAFSEDGTFGYPTGSYNTGDAIVGGGTVIYMGSNTSFAHTGLTENSSYCYKVFRVKNGSQYSFGKTVCAKTYCTNSTLLLPFTEGFEGKELSVPDVCTWEIQNNTSNPDALKIVTAGINPAAPLVQGSSMLRFNAFSIAADETARLVSSFIKKGIGNSMDLRFRWYQDSSDYTDASFNGEGVLVQWSADRSNWQPLEYYPRVPVQGRTGWSYKQLTLPDSSLQKDTVYIALLFTSRYGNNCYLDDLHLQVSTYKPSDATTATAVCEFTDSTSSWTHYYDAAGNRLLSIKKNGQNIGKAGQNAFTLKLGPTGTSAIAASSDYVSNPGGWICMNRYYSVKPVNEPSAPISVRYYYTTTDFNALKTAAAMLNPSRTNIAQTDLYAWKINDISAAYDVNPANGHAGIPKATRYSTNGFTQYVNAGIADTTTWQYKNPGNNLHSMEYTTKYLGGGGLGIGSVSGRGAFQIITYTFTGNGNWSTAANWSGGNKPPAILPNNGSIVIDPVAGGECVLDVSQTVPAGASITVQPGKKLLVKDKLQIRN